MNVLVIGDSCKDVFIYGDIERISPEAPIPVFKPTHEESNGGMAKNVADNVEALDIHIHTVTNKNNITKIRFVENRSSQMVLRVDEHDHCERIDESLLEGLVKNKFKQPPFGFDSRREDYYDAISYYERALSNADFEEQKYLISLDLADISLIIGDYNRSMELVQLVLDKAEPRSTNYTRAEELFGQIKYTQSAS